MLFLIQSFGVYFNYNVFWSCFLNPCKWLMQIILYLLNLQCLLGGGRKKILYIVFFYFYFFILCVFKCWLYIKKIMAELMIFASYKASHAWKTLNCHTSWFSLPKTALRPLRVTLDRCVNTVDSTWIIFLTKSTLMHGGGSVLKVSSHCDTLNPFLGICKMFPWSSQSLSVCSVYWRIISTCWQ